MPPTSLTDLEDEAFALEAFVPAPEVGAWLRETFIDEGAALENPDHAHLAMADIGVVWTNAGNSRHGRRVVGTAELCPPMVAAGKWIKARLVHQLQEWFGEVPDFLITLDAMYAAECSDVEWCAVIEHELYHCGQETDVHGFPKFSRDGTPKWAIRGHDVEEFTGVVRRYGVASPDVRALVDAANAAPEIAPAAIAGACGTCLQRAA